jgi:hypothetical protein
MHWLKGCGGDAEIVTEASRLVTKWIAA